MKYRIFIFTITLFSIFSISAQQADMAGSLNSFSFDLYKQLKSDKENLFFSPFSIDVALLMVREGARSDTKAGFDKTLHIDANVNSDFVRDFILGLKSLRYSSNSLTVSNSIWIKQDYKIKADFQNRIQTNYFADVFNVNFADRFMSAAKINKWTAQKTNNLIKDIISEGSITSSTKLIIINAIYFKDKWDREFDKDMTKKNDFYGMNNDTVKIDFMHETSEYKYFENADFQYLSKDYEGNDKSFCVILPKKRYGISTIDTLMNTMILDSVFKQEAYTLVDLSIPKFKMETSYSLNESLSMHGLKRAFAGDADFTGISTASGFRISNVVHKTYIDVNEDKTEAAAATLIGCTDSCMPSDDEHKAKVFNADHPFMFMIIDNKTKGIIFMGKYVKEK
jgi:serpin B